MGAAQRIEWFGEYPALLWSLHPCAAIDDDVEPANDNAHHLALIERRNVPQSGTFFPHARAGRRPSTRQGEAQPAQAHRAEQARGWGLILEDFLYDVVGNPVEIRDWRDPEEWPTGAKPVTKKIEYDDLYRATRVKYEYAAGDDAWTSPFDAENDGEVGGPPSDAGPRRAKPSPHISFEQRILDQKFEYDWVGNSEKTSDDADGFYDRSLGDITNDSQNDKPYQLRSAQLASTQLDRGGHLEARYDAAGHLSALAVEREGTCLGGASSDACNQQFVYDWDEVGRLARARRWDGNTDSVDTFHPGSAGTPEADLRHVYDASDQRVLKEAVDEAGEHSYTLYVFASLELRRAQYGTTFSDSGVSGDSDYEVSHWTVAPYLMANGVRLARLVYHGSGVVPEDGTGSSGGPGVVNASTSQLHVFFELGDHLGSTSVVLDKATGELVERATFQAYGGAESDYRPGRWDNFREDYRFTGKEEDVEVGLQYFGKRYLNPLLGRWVSADPLAVHAPGQADLNVYAYVSGAVLKSIDPLGLDDEGVNGGGDSDIDSGATTDAAAEGTGGASAVESAGTGHEGAPSDGAAEQGGKDGNILEALPTPLKQGLAVAGELGNALNPLAVTGDSVCRGQSDCSQRQGQAAASGFMTGAGWGALKTGRALTPAAKSQVLSDLDEMGNGIVQQIEATGSRPPVTRSAGAMRAATPTDLEGVAVHVESNGSLPVNFITKEQARVLGWDPRAGNLSEVAPGKSIGGDPYQNRSGALPSAEGRQYFEADLNYSSGRRGSERLIYSNDGLMYYSNDHYQSFQQVIVE